MDLPASLPPTDPTLRARRGSPLPEVPDRPPAGSLVILDDFVSSSTRAPHGNISTFAAEQQGFRGNVYAEALGPDEYQTRPSQMILNTLQLLPQEPAQTRQMVQNYAQFAQQELQIDVSQDLSKLGAKGLHHSAVNVSMDTNPQRAAEVLASTALRGIREPEYRLLTQNLFSAYDIDPSKFTHPDSKIAKPERARFLQGLLDDSQQGSKHPSMAETRKVYDQAVRNLEANHNSVVVSAGNQQQSLGDMERFAGQKLRTSPDSKRNALANPDVTMVGATRWMRNDGQLREHIANYSTRDSEVDIYASGAVGAGLDPQVSTAAGTSFAAPRVAAAMAALHGRHPQASSQQVQRMLQEQLTHSLDTPSGTVPVLDYQTTADFLRDRTF